MNPRSVLPVFALVLAVCAGCVSETGPFAPQDTTKFTLENTDRFVLLDQPAQYSVTCTGLQERVLADGRLEVVANVKNRENRRIEFLDREGRVLAARTRQVSFEVVSRDRDTVVILSELPR